MELKDGILLVCLYVYIVTTNLPNQPENLSVLGMAWPNKACKLIWASFESEGEINLVYVGGS